MSYVKWVQEGSKDIRRFMMDNVESLDNGVNAYALSDEMILNPRFQTMLLAHTREDVGLLNINLAYLAQASQWIRLLLFVIASLLAVDIFA